MAPGQPNPEWLDRLLPEFAARAAQADGSPSAAQRPPSRPQVSLGEVLMMVLFWLPGLLAPLLAAWFLRGSWHLAMLVPAPGMAFVTLRFAVDV